MGIGVSLPEHGSEGTARLGGIGAVGSISLGRSAVRGLEAWATGVRRVLHQDRAACEAPWTADVADAPRFPAQEHGLGGKMSSWFSSRGRSARSRWIFSHYAVLSDPHPPDPQIGEMGLKSHGKLDN